MLKYISRRNKNPNQFNFIGEKILDDTKIQLFTFDKNNFDEKSIITNLNEINFEKSDKKYWLNFHGIHDSKTISEFCSQIGIHKLVIQDILDTNQRPKFQPYEDYYFFSIKSVLPNEQNIITIKQLSFILGSNYIISFQEENDHFFDHVRERIREDIGIVRERSLDYLFYLLIESVLDVYLKTYESFENRLSVINDFNMSDDPSPTIITSIEELKNKIYQINKLLLPIKEFLIKTDRESMTFVDKKHQKYYNDLKDLCFQIYDYNDSMERTLESKINLFFSFQGQKMKKKFFSLKNPHRGLGTGVVI